MKSLYESIFNVPKSENITDLVFSDVLKKLILGDKGTKPCISLLDADEQFDVLKPHSYYDKKTASIHIGCGSPQAVLILGLYDLPNMYKICKDNGLIVNNIIFDFKCLLDIRNKYKTYDGRNKISKIINEIPMSISIYDGEYKNMDFSEVNIAADNKSYSIFNIHDSTLTNVNLGSHPQNSLFVTSQNPYSTGPILFDNVTGEFKDAQVFIHTQDSSKWSKDIFKAYFNDFDPTIKHNDEGAVTINPNILADLGLDKLKCKRIDIALKHDNVNDYYYFLIRVSNGKMKLMKYEHK